MRSVSLPDVSRATIGALHVQNSRSPKPATTETTITCQLVWTSGYALKATSEPMTMGATRELESSGQLQRSFCVAGSKAWKT